MKMVRQFLYWYFRGKKWEAEGGLYKAIGVHQFKKIVPFGDYFFRFVRLFNPRFRVLRIRQEFSSLVFFTLMIETIHFAGFILMNAFLFRSYDRTARLSYKTLFINILVNVLPILVQRYNRIRLLRMSKIDFKWYMLRQ